MGATQLSKCMIFQNSFDGVEFIHWQGMEGFSVILNVQNPKPLQTSGLWQVPDEYLI